MIVYHGSSEIVRKPDTLHSYRALDFGKGFYVTDVREQAERWARRKADLIIGKVADDKVFRVVDMYHSGIWDRERALQEIRVYPNYGQIAFASQDAIDRLLTFDRSWEV
jgi:hypothetical protein